MLTAKSFFAIIAAIVVVGGGVFLMTRNPAPAAPSGAAAPAASAGQSSSKKVPFDQVMRQAGPYVCTVNENVAGASGKGTVYIANGEISGAFDASLKGVHYSAWTITRDGFTYSWSSLAPKTGFKSPAIKTQAAGGASAPASGTYGANGSAFGDYDCVAWTPDQSKFDLPASITFTELGQK